MHGLHCSTTERDPVPARTLARYGPPDTAYEAVAHLPHVLQIEGCGRAGLAKWQRSGELA